MEKTDYVFAVLGYFLGFARFSLMAFWMPFGSRKVGNGRMCVICPVTGCTDMANFKPAAGSHDVNPLFLAFLKKQNDTSGIGPKDIETEPTSTEKKDGDTEKGIKTLTRNLRGAETQGHLASIAVGFSAWSAAFAVRLSLTLAFRCCYSSFGWPQDEIWL